MGLFDNSAVDPALTSAIGSQEHRAVARECVHESLVLLKNENHALPLSKQIKHLVVVGEAADDLGVQCGGWTISWQGNRGNVTHGGTTILSAIRKTVSPETEVTFSPNGNGVNEADAVIVVVGEQPYAEANGRPCRFEFAGFGPCADCKSQSDGRTRRDHIAFRTSVILNSALNDSNAFVAAWLPGTEGLGVTDALFGDFKFTGKLPRTWPHNNEHIRAGNAAGTPLFPFGFGLTD